ncbi:MAG TPA: RraA family protein [Tepidisphaeraceae bacterium]|nr:RraA family protein [Tepidisphaeraceae bacterium]
MTVVSKQKELRITLAMMRQHLYAAVVCDALDAMGLRHQSPRVQFGALTGVRKIVGRCKTTRWVEMTHDDPNTYEMELRAVDSCQSDDVIIAAANGSMRSGIWGELLSTAASNSGCVGAIVDGAVRDIEKMTAMKFGVFAKGTSPYDSMNRQRVVEYDVPVGIDGVRFNPGDLIIADIDGVVVVPAEVEEEAIRRAWEKVHAENVTRDAIKKGMKATAAYEKYGVL